MKIGIKTYTINAANFKDKKSVKDFNKKVKKWKKSQKAN